VRPVGPATYGRPMKDEIRIRRGAPEEAAELARLRYAFRAELDPPVESESAFVARCTGWMHQQLGPGGSWSCWVAADGTALVGTVWLQLIEKLPNPVGHAGFHGYVSSVYVVPHLRNTGIGSALLAACVTEAGTKGLDALFLWPTDLSRPLYERQGFAVPEDLLERRSGTDPRPIGC
jgi:GNAT superfamily N-acetyltransferase